MNLTIWTRRQNLLALNLFPVGQELKIEGSQIGESRQVSAVFTMQNSAFLVLRCTGYEVAVSISSAIAVFNSFFIVIVTRILGSVCFLKTHAANQPLPNKAYRRPTVFYIVVRNQNSCPSNSFHLYHKQSRQPSSRLSGNHR